MTKPKSRLNADVRWALKGAYAVAAVYCLWVLGVYVIGGDEPFTQLGVPFLSVEGFYLVAAGLAGLVIGVMRPLTRWAAGAYLVGYAAGMILSSCLAVLLSGNPMHWGIRELLLIIIMGIFGGSIIGRELKKNAGILITRRGNR